MENWKKHNADFVHAEKQKIKFVPVVQYSSMWVLPIYIVYKMYRKFAKIIVYGFVSSYILYYTYFFINKYALYKSLSLYLLTQILIFLHQSIKPPEKKNLKICHFINLLIINEILNAKFFFDSLKYFFKIKKLNLYISTSYESGSLVYQLREKVTNFPSNYDKMTFLFDRKWISFNARMFLEIIVILDYFFS